MKTTIKLIAVILILVISLFLLLRCYYISKINIYPEGYTGGLNYDESYWKTGLQIFWVETYDEYLTAVEQLRSHGSTFSGSAIFSYEGDLFDTKYCFTFSNQKDSIEYGENPFDRYASYVFIQSYAFFEDVTIDELVFSNVSNYRGHGLHIYSELMFYNEDIVEENIEYKCEKVIWEYSQVPEECVEVYKYHGYYKNELMFSMQKSDLMTDECFDAIMNSIEIIQYGE